MKRVLIILFSAMVQQALCQEPTGQVESNKYMVEEVVELLARKNYPGKPTPKISIIPGAGNYELSFIGGATPEIRIGEAVLKYCATFKEFSLDALAFMLAHELSHYYSGHNVKSSTIGQKFLEMDADYTGLWMAFYAGYRSLAIAKEVLSDYYNLLSVQKSAKYPELEERLLAVDSIVVKLERQVVLYQTASFLQHRQYYRESAELFKLIVPNLTAPEVNNGLASSLIYEALEYMPDQSRYFMFPIEVAPAFRLERRLQRSGGANTKRFNENLDEAISILKNVLRFNEDYYPSLLNLSIAYYLKGELDKGKEFLEQYGSARMKPINYMLMKAILADANGQTDMAKDYLRKAVKKGDDYAEYNYKMYKTPERKLPNKLPKYIREETNAQVEGKLVKWSRPSPKFKRLTTINGDNRIIVETGIDRELVISVKINQDTGFLLYPGYTCKDCDRGAVELRRKEVLKLAENLNPDETRVTRYNNVTIKSLLNDNLILFYTNNELVSWIRYEIN